MLHWPERMAKKSAAPSSKAAGSRKRLVGAGIDVLHEDVAALHVVDELLVEALEAGLVDGDVHVAPPDVAFGRRLADDELVLRRAPGVLSGPHDERAVRGDDSLAVAHRVLVQLGGGQVAVGRLDRRRCR